MHAARKEICGVRLPQRFSVNLQRFVTQKKCQGNYQIGGLLAPRAHSPDRPARLHYRHRARYLSLCSTRKDNLADFFQRRARSERARARVGNFPSGEIRDGILGVRRK